MELFVLGPRCYLQGSLITVRKCHGTKNMAVVRNFALKLVWVVKDKKSVKVRRKLAGWSTS